MDENEKGERCGSGAGLPDVRREEMSSVATDITRLSSAAVDTCGLLTLWLRDGTDFISDVPDVVSVCLTDADVLTVVASIMADDDGMLLTIYGEGGVPSDPMPVASLDAAVALVDATIPEV